MSLSFFYSVCILLFIYDVSIPIVNVMEENSQRSRLRLCHCPPEKNSKCNVVFALLPGAQFWAWTVNSATWKRW
jgi:hypothetical protein